MKRIIFVCTGNTCRSPMAEKIFNAKVKEKNIDAEAISRGVMCSDGLNMNVNARIVMKENCLSAEHKSKLISLDDINSADYILTVTSSHKRYLEDMFGRHKNVLSMGEITNHGDIDDPYGGDVDVYRRCYKLLDLAIDIIIEKLL